MTSRRRPDVADCRAAWWALRSLRRLRRPGHSLAPLTQPPPLPDRAVRGVRAVLARRHATCLERSRVLQAWESAHGRPADVVVGVNVSEGGFRAHAWLEGEARSMGSGQGFEELTRFPAPEGRRERGR